MRIIILGRKASKVYSHKLGVKCEVLQTCLESNLTICPEIKAMALQSFAAHTAGNLPAHAGPWRRPHPQGTGLGQSGAGSLREH